MQAFVDGPYRALPWQTCHNDITANNVLVDAGRASAVLDFEFATPAARALDVAMGLRTTMQIWENPEPWEVVRRFCRAYTRWMPMVEAEVIALPQLIRLRSAIVVLWWLGRMAAPGDVAAVLRGMQYLQTQVRWLDRYAEQFVDVVQREVL